MYDTIEIDIVAFIPEKAVDPLCYDKAYFLAPDKRGAKSLNGGDAKLWRRHVSAVFRCRLHRVIGCEMTIAPPRAE